MKTRSPDYIEEHYMTKPAVALMVLFLWSSLFWQKDILAYTASQGTIRSYDIL